MNPRSHRKLSFSIGTLAAAVIAGAAHAASDEAAELKAAVTALQQRIGQLEAQASAAEQTNDRQTDQIAVVRSNVGSWVQNFTFKGDFRYRNETIDQQYVPARNRDRMRVRAGFVARVNDTVRTEFSLATSEGNDPRSSNQTLTGENTRKNVFIDLAYVEWQPLQQVKFTAGKMKYPWFRPGSSVLFDGDVNIEGIAANWSRGGLFASAFYNHLEERAATGESSMGGGQVGWKSALGGGQLTLAAGLFDFNSVRGRNPFFNGSANGNTTTATGCIGGATTCLAWDYNLIEGSAEYTRPVGGRPLTLFADYISNDAADNGFDTALSVGFTWGRATDPRTWEVGYFYQQAGKDAVFGQFIDSDLGGGNTDYGGHVVRAGYAIARNWTANLTWHVGHTNRDAPVTIAAVGTVHDRDYERLQLDLNFKY
ncbi:MAG: putative porin [Pseudomonadota bacterium]|nr:putative porin [Pseudomonadota bacterium]